MYVVWLWRTLIFEISVRRAFSHFHYNKSDKQFIFLSLFLVSASPSIFLITKCPRITGCYLLRFQSSSFHLLGPDYAINCLKLWGKLYNPVSIHVRKLKVLSAGLLASKLIFAVVDAALVDGLQVWLSHERACNEQHFRAFGCWVQGNQTEHFLSWVFHTEGKKKRKGGRLTEERSTSPLGNGVRLTLRGANLKEVLDPSVMESSKTQTFCILIHLCLLPGVKALNWVLKQVLHGSKFCNFGLKRSVVETILRLLWSQVNG